MPSRTPSATSATAPPWQPTASATERGKEARVEALFGQYASYVAALGLRLLGRDAEVDDLVQDVFLRAYEALDGLRDPNAAKGWLATITVRMARRRLRLRRAKSWLGLDDAPEAHALPDTCADPEDQALLSQILRALDHVPTDARIAWSLRHLEGLPLADVATCCGCSLATVKRRIDAAHATLRKRLTDA